MTSQKEIFSEFLKSIAQAIIQRIFVLFLLCLCVKLMQFKGFWNNFLPAISDDPLKKFIEGILCFFFLLLYMTLSPHHTACCVTVHFLFYEILLLFIVFWNIFCCLFGYTKYRLLKCNFCIWTTYVIFSNKLCNFRAILKSYNLNFLLYFPKFLS